MSTKEAASGLTRRNKAANRFISKARAVHGERYDYSGVDYSYATVPVTIYCPLHDLKFEQTPTVHLRGHRCPECGRDVLKTPRILDFEQAKKVVQKQTGINSRNSYIAWTKSEDFPRNMPKDPPASYRRDWPGWDVFLGQT